MKETVPQGAKARLYIWRFRGTTEVVPFQNGFKLAHHRLICGSD
jgi:hypothetical protein